MMQLPPQARPELDERVQSKLDRVARVKMIEMVVGRLLLAISMFILVFQDDVLLPAIFAALALLEPMGAWLLAMRYERDVLEAYREVYGGNPTGCAKMTNQEREAVETRKIVAYITTVLGVALIVASLVMASKGSTYAWMPVIFSWGCTVFGTRRPLEKHRSCV